MSAVLTHPSATAAAPAPGVPTLPDAGEPSPAERLARSREELRALMMEMAAPHQRRPVGAPGVRIAAASLFDRVALLPGVGVVIEAARSWWAHHPWRAVTLVATDAGRAAVAPLAQRHPIALVAGAALLGALALRWGPWRWLIKPAMLAGFLPRLLTRAAVSIPMESWLSGLAAFSRPKSQAGKSEVRPART